MVPANKVEKNKKFSTLLGLIFIEITRGPLVTGLSDHFSNFISVKGPRFDDNNKPKPSYKQVRQLNENNVKGFKKSISIVDWDFVNQDNNP